MKVPFKIIAVGNDFYGDDGIGAAVIDTISTLVEFLDEFKNLSMVNGATDALGLIDHFQDTTHVIIIDAARMGTRPGTVKTFDIRSVKTGIKNDHISVHGLSLSDTFKIAEEVNLLPEYLTIIGIEPENLGISEPLSDSVKGAIPAVITELLSIIHNSSKLKAENHTIIPGAYNVHTRVNHFK